MIVFGIHSHVFIDLPTPLKIYRSTAFYFLQGKIWPPKKSGVRPKGIRCNLSWPTNEQYLIFFRRLLRIQNLGGKVSSGNTS